MAYKLIDAFETLFRGHPYLHRNSSLGDFVASHLYEDLYDLGKSQKFNARADSREWVVNSANTRQGIRARRGDGTFGEIVPRESALSSPPFHVGRGIVATIEIGAEVKILAKAMIKQIDRVIGDLEKQVHHFGRNSSNRPISVGIIGINHAAYTVGYEGERSYRTDGKSNRHPVQEAEEAERRLVDQAKPHFDEFIILRYEATNDAPFEFRWRDQVLTEKDYGAALLRICREYDKRF